MKRPHTATVRLTESQYALAKEKFARDRGMSWQKLLTAAVNAYVQGDFIVKPDGTYTISEPSAISYGDDDDAVDLADLLEPHEGRPYGSQKSETIGTRELAKLAERRTGRRVAIPVLRRLVRERFPQEENPGPGTRYRWETTDPEVDEIIEAIGAGALDELRRRALRTASEAKRSDKDPSAPD